MAVRTLSSAASDRVKTGKLVVRDLKILGRFVQVWCRDHHGERERKVVTTGGEVGKILENLDVVLCDECRDIFLHGASRRILCPLDPKPACKRCPAPCYRPGHRESIRTIMGYSGKKIILSGRLDYLTHYFF